MTVAVRVVPCLDVRAGFVTKGVRFLGNRDIGDPVQMARQYNDLRADELVFYDITASAESRDITLDMVRQVADEIFIPFTVGGGLRSVDDVDKMLRAGADKVSLNTSAVEHPELITEVATRFGSQCAVVSIDILRDDSQPSGWGVTTHGGRRRHDIDLVHWVQECEGHGAGEIVLNSMDADGTREGFDTAMLAAVRRVTSIPIVASGGAGTVQHFADAAYAGADAVLAASVLHDGSVSLEAIKAKLAECGFPVR